METSLTRNGILDEQPSTQFECAFWPDSHDHRIFLLDNPAEKTRATGVFLLFMPLIILCFFFFISLLLFVWYNWVASLIGGVEFEVEESDAGGLP